MLSDAQYDFIADGCEDMELDAIWDYFSKPFGSPFLPLDISTFEDRRDAFLWVLERLLREGRIVLIRLGTQSSIDGEISDQIQRFLEAFPKTDGEMDGGLWFFSPSCPGGAAWQRRS